MQLVPRRFFVTSGKAVSQISEMNAFDQALVDAGIAEANLVPVSSVLSKGIRQVEKHPIASGTITFCVLSRISRQGKTTISAGLSYGFVGGKTSGYVAEAQVEGKETDLKEELKRRLNQMANHRGMKIGKAHNFIETLEVPKNYYGSCILVLVLLP